MAKSRNFQGEADLLEMQEFLMRARRQTSLWRYPHVGELLFNFFMVECHLDPQEHIRLWHAGEGALVAYAMLGEDPAFDVQVAPEYEWTGIEEAALAWADTLLERLRRKEPERWEAGLVWAARQDNARRIAFLEQHGFRYRGEFAEDNLLRSLEDPFSEVSVPAGFFIRAVEAGDLHHRAEAQREVWQPWTVGNVCDEDYARFMRLPGYRQDLDVVAVTQEGIIAAYAIGWLDPLNLTGNFGPVGARSAYRRKGLTRAVLLEGMRRLRDYGMKWVCVSTTISNLPARRLYESVGFRVVNQTLDYVRQN